MTPQEREGEGEGPVVPSLPPPLSPPSPPPAGGESTTTMTTTPLPPPASPRPPALPPPAPPPAIQRRCEAEDDDATIEQRRDADADAVRRLVERTAATINSDPAMLRRARELALDPTKKRARKTNNEKKDEKEKKKKMATKTKKIATKNNEKRKKKKAEKKDVAKKATSAAVRASTTSREERRRRPQRHRRYYAVRAGYATTEYPRRRSAAAAGRADALPLVVRAFRSAIFFRLEDASIFPEYEAFDTLEEAEEYLRKGEEELVDDHNDDDDAFLDAFAASQGETSTTATTAPSLERSGVPTPPPPLETTPNGAGGDHSETRPTTTTKTAGAEGTTSTTTTTTTTTNQPRNDWDKMFRKLEEYKESHGGSVDVPPKEKGSIALRRWLDKQFRLYQDHVSLSPDRIDRLAAIGVTMPPSWDDMHDRLAARRAATGALDAPRSADPELHAWIKAQKLTLVRHFRGERAPAVALDIERVRRLEALGYAPSRPGIIRPGGIVDAVATEGRWEAMLEELRRFKERNGGSLAVPDDGSERALKVWVSEQRREFKRLGEGRPSNLTARRMQRLTGVGFDPSPGFEYVPWERRMEGLRRFAREHGHCSPPTLHPELGVFVSEVRKLHKRRARGERTTLTEDRVRDLEELGFVFQAGKSPKRRSRNMSWEERFRQLLQYKEDHGHTVVPQQSGTLGEWVRLQRVEYKRYKGGRTTRMTAERALKLTEVGFCFDASRKFSGSSKGT